MRATIHVEMDSPAFDDGSYGRAELQRVLQQATDRVDHHLAGDGFDLFDLNGVKVGRVQFGAEPKSQEPPPLSAHVKGCACGLCWSHMEPRPEPAQEPPPVLPKPGHPFRFTGETRGDNDTGTEWRICTDCGWPESDH